MNYENAPASGDRRWGLFAHLSALILAFMPLLPTGFIGPLVILLTKGKNSPFIRAHAVEALNFQITLLVGFVIALLLFVLTYGLGSVLLLPLTIVAYVFIIMGSIAANKGETYRYPLTIRLVK